MPRPKGSPNKITSKVRSKLQYLLDDLIDSLDLDELDNNQAIIKHKCVEQAYAISPWSKMRDSKDERFDVIIEREEVSDYK